MIHDNKQKTHTNYEEDHPPSFKRTTLATSILLATLGATGVHAQEASETDQLSMDMLEEIVVTGTLIRGTEVTGSQTIGLDLEQIVEVGAVNTNEILASVPQISNFFNDRAEVEPRGSANLVVSRPNLRNLPRLNSSTGSVTLVLMDSHRIAPVGVQAAIVDAGIILAPTLQSVDIVTDGGSSLYGADAVAGVINFITKDEFDGVKIDLDYGSAEDMNTTSINLAAGTSWNTGSIYVAATSSERDGLQQKDRDWAKIGTYDDDGNFVLAGESARTECLKPNESLYGWFNYGAGFTDNPAAPGAGAKAADDATPCNHFAESTLLPEQERDGLFLSYQQELNDKVKLGVKSYYSALDNSFFSYPLGDIAPAPFDVTTNPGSLTQAQIDEFGLTDPSTVGAFQLYNYAGGPGFSYGAHPAYPNRQQQVEMFTWGIAPELTIEVGDAWQLRNTLYYGQSHNKNLQPESNNQKLADYVAAGQFDPLSVASADVAVLNDILNWETEKQTIHELFLARVVADGPVMELPAGQLRVAAGFEFNQDRVRTRTNTGEIGSLSDLDFNRVSRDNTSVFGEVHIPVLETLDLSLSLRHDDYSDFGKSTTPQAGFTFTPTDWLRVYGHWGESFNAPTNLDSLALSDGRAANQTVIQVTDADVNNEWDGQGTQTVIWQGAQRGVAPQTAETWALGFDLEPVDGLMFKLNYYDIEVTGLIGGLGVPTEQIRRDFPDKFIWNVSVEEWAEFLSLVQNPEAFDGVIDPNDPNAELAYIFDRRVTNFGEARLKGFDFGASYFHETDFGTMNYSLSGNHQTKLTLAEGGVVSDELEDAPDLTFQGKVGWSRDNVRATLTVNYTDSFEPVKLEDGDFDTSNQSKVDAFIVTNLFVGYDFQGGNGITDGLSVRFNIDNVFDEDPPEYRHNNVNEDKHSGFTLGRMFKVGISKTFF